MWAPPSPAGHLEEMPIYTLAPGLTPPRGAEYPRGSGGEPPGAIEQIGTTCIPRGSAYLAHLTMHSSTCPSTVAVTVVVPRLTQVTRPVSLMAALEESLLVQITGPS